MHKDLAGRLPRAFNSYAKIARNQTEETRDITNSSRLTTFFAKLNKGRTATCQHKLQNQALNLTPSAPQKTGPQKYQNSGKNSGEKFPTKLSYKNARNRTFFAKCRGGPIWAQKRLRGRTNVLHSACSCFWPVFGRGFLAPKFLGICKE